MQVKSSEPILELREVTTGYGDRTVLTDLTLRVARGELLVLFGPNGSGKSTLIRTMAGLLTSRRGAVYLNGRDVRRVAPHDRERALMFRNLGYSAEMTVAQNVGLALKMRGIESSEIGRRTEQLLARVRLQNEAATEATQLSLGEQQRANLARVLATGAPLLLMHEPLVHVDPDLRRDLGTELRAFQEESGATIVLSLIHI